MEAKGRRLRRSTAVGTGQAPVRPRGSKCRPGPGRPRAPATAARQPAPAQGVKTTVIICAQFCGSGCDVGSPGPTGEPRAAPADGGLDSAPGSVPSSRRLSWTCSQGRERVASFGWPKRVTGPPKWKGGDKPTCQREEQREHGRARGHGEGGGALGHFCDYSNTPSVATQDSLPRRTLLSVKRFRGWTRNRVREGGPVGRGGWGPWLQPQTTHPLVLQTLAAPLPQGHRTRVSGRGGTPLGVDVPPIALQAPGRLRKTPQP